MNCSISGNRSRSRHPRNTQLPPKQKHHQLPLPQKLQAFLTHYNNCLRHAFNVGVQHNRTRPRLSPPTKLYRNTRCTLNCVPRILAARRAEASPKATSSSQQTQGLHCNPSNNSEESDDFKKQGAKENKHQTQTVQVMRPFQVVLIIRTTLYRTTGQDYRCTSVVLCFGLLSSVQNNL